VIPKDAPVTQHWKYEMMSRLREVDGPYPWIGQLETECRQISADCATAFQRDIAIIVTSHRATKRSGHQSKKDDSDIMSSDLHSSIDSVERTHSKPMDISSDEFHKFFNKSPDKKVLKSITSDSKLGTDPNLEEEVAEKVMSRIR
jgi:hypothetical protein